MVSRAPTDSARAGAALDDALSRLARAERERDEARLEADRYSTRRRVPLTGGALVGLTGPLGGGNVGQCHGVRQSTTRTGRAAADSNDRTGGRFDAAIASRRE